MSDYFDDDIDEQLLFELDTGIVNNTNNNTDNNTSKKAPNSKGKSVPKQKTILDYHQPELRMDTVNTHNPIALESYHTIDESQISKWVYPINYPLRDYQFNICRSTLFKNTLVCLPTGLGKTFIAAVTMYNYYRWFPTGKIVFLAPTKPLVNQQIDACFKITGIKKDDVVELTGTVQQHTRMQEYKKRVMFMTPETFRNDIISGVCPYKQVVLIVFDEAHRATGNYAYCDIIREMATRDAVFRVLALSATPGSDSKRVQAVVDNLMIEKIESRSEESIDVQKYIFKRNVQECVVPMSANVQTIVDRFGGLMKAYLKTLVDNNCYSFENPAQASSFGLMQRRDGWRAKFRNSLAKPLQMKIEACFAISISLVAILQTLQNTGIRGFYNALTEFCHEVKQKSNPSKTRLDFVNNPKLIELINDIKKMMEQPLFSSHPKFDKMIEVVLAHFSTHEEYVREQLSKNEPVDTQTKIMIFSNHRATVEEIVQTLQKHRPIVRPAAFIGQASGKKTSGLKQKQQLQVIEDFMAGLFNVLVSTSIGEEGLDIGEIDLIICFDVSKSPIRLLQRQGRTGRKRIGNICLLLNEGVDESAVKNARAQYKTIQKAIAEGKKLEFYNGKLAGIIPSIYTPTCEQVHIDIVEEERRPTKKVSRTSSKSKVGPFLPPEQEKVYEEMYFKDAGHIPPIDVGKHAHWQTQSLKQAIVPHSEICETYISLMEYFADLKAEQEPAYQRMITKDDPLSQIPTGKKVKKKAIFTTILASDSDSGLQREPREESRNILHLDSDAEKSELFPRGIEPTEPPIVHIIDTPAKEKITPRKTEVVFASPIAPFEYQSSDPFENENNQKESYFIPPRTPRLYEKNVIEEDESDNGIDLFTMDQSIHFHKGEMLVSPVVAEQFPESPLLDQISPISFRKDDVQSASPISIRKDDVQSDSPISIRKDDVQSASPISFRIDEVQSANDSIQIVEEKQANELVKSSPEPIHKGPPDVVIVNINTDETFEFDDFDEMDFEVIAQLEKEHKLPKNETPSKSMTQSDGGSIRPAKRAKKIVINSSSPFPDSIRKSIVEISSPDIVIEAADHIQDLRQRILDRKNTKRQVPKARRPLTPTALVKPLTDFPKKKKAKKNYLAKAFVDFEAELSGEKVSSDEVEEQDRDLSGFVVGNSTNNSPANTSIGFYQRSLLSPNQGGMGKVVGNKFRLAPIRFTHTNQVMEDEESMESLADFIVNDSQVDYESQNIDSFLDEPTQAITREPSIIEIDSCVLQDSQKKTKPASSEFDYFANDIDMDDLDLDDMVEF